MAHLDGANQTPEPIDTNTTAGALSRLGDACAEPCARGSAQQPLALGACMQQTAGSLVPLSFLAAGHACLCAVAQPSTHPPGPAPSDLCAVFQIVIGKTYASWVLGVEGIDEMTMAHIHYVSCLSFLSPVGGRGASSAPGGVARCLPLAACPQSCALALAQGNATTNGLPIVLLTPYAPVSALEAMDLPMYTPPLSGLSKYRCVSGG